MVGLHGPAPEPEAKRVSKPGALWAAQRTTTADAGVGALVAMRVVQELFFFVA